MSGRWDFGGAGEADAILMPEGEDVGLSKPIPAYRGSEPYVFVCYAHRDSDTVYSDVVLLDQNGIKVWYDEGIPAGKSWRAEIAAAIQDATKFILFISEASLNSAHCLREVDYALNHDIEIIPVYLDDSTLPAELELVLNRVQALFRRTDSMYMQHLLGALQERTRFTPLVAKRKGRKLAVPFSILAVGLGLLSIPYWPQWGSKPASEPSDGATINSPNAFDRYLEGLELMKRWDRDDNLDAAIRSFREASTLDPGFALAFARLADALRTEYALTGDESWLDEAADKAEEGARLNAGLAPVQVALGRVQTSRGNFDLALAALERALSIDANDAVANQAIATVYERLGRLQDAEEAFRKAVALDSEDPSILDAFANFLYGQSRFEEAAHEWQTAIRLAPDHYATLVNFGAALTETGRIPEAITMYERAIRIRPTYMAYSNLGTAYSRGERYPDAVDAYRKALEIDDTNWLAWGNLAYVYSWMNGMDAQATETFEHAIELAEAARQRDPRDPFVHSDLALYYAKMGRPELALQRLETAVTLSPDSGEILAAGAEVHELNGQRDKAIELARAALDAGFKRQQLQRNPELSGLLADPRMQPQP